MNVLIGKDFEILYEKEEKLWKKKTKKAEVMLY